MTLFHRLYLLLKRTCPTCRGIGLVRTHHNFENTAMLKVLDCERCDGTGSIWRWQ